MCVCVCVCVCVSVAYQCTSLVLPVSLQKENDVKGLSPLCIICEFVMSKLEKMIVKNSTEVGRMRICVHMCVVKIFCPVLRLVRC